MNLFKSLLFLHGYITDPHLATELARCPPASTTPHWSKTMNFFKSLLYLGGLDSISLRIGEEEEAYGPTYGNRIASEQKFGKPPATRPQPAQPKFAQQEPLGCH